jgi:hypothetical protein
MTPSVAGARAPNRASTAAVPALLWQAIIWAATAQAAAGVADLARDAFAQGSLSPGRLLMLAHVLVFGAVGGTLIRYGRGDDRARSLGAALLLTAAVFARSTVQPRGDPAGWAALVEAAFALRVDALTPYFTWRFAGEFPRALTSVRGRRWLGRVTRVALGLGLVLVVANALSAAAAHVDALRALAPLLARLSRREAGSLYFPLQYLLAAAAFVVLVLRARRAPADERRRVRLLVWGLVAGTAPAIAWVLLASVVPGFIEVLPVRRAGWVVYPALLSTPISTAYAVLVRRALDVRVVVRRALQYALTRYSTIAFAAVPAVLLVGLLYRRRGESVGAALASADAAALLALTAGGVALLRGRAGLLSRIDRRFFREQHDARRVLADLVERCRAAGDRAELSRALVAGLDRALHPGAVASCSSTATTRRSSRRPTCGRSRRHPRSRRPSPTRPGRSTSISRTPRGRRARSPRRISTGCSTAASDCCCRCATRGRASPASWR